MEAALYITLEVVLSFFSFLGAGFALGMGWLLAEKVGVWYDER